MFIQFTFCYLETVSLTSDIGGIVLILDILTPNIVEIFCIK